MSSTLWPVQRSLSEITVLNCPMITSFFYFRWKAACDAVLCSVSLEFFFPCDCIALFTVCYATNIKEIGGAYCFWVVCPFATRNSPARYLKKEGQYCPVSVAHLITGWIGFWISKLRPWRQSWISDRNDWSSVFIYKLRLCFQPIWSQLVIRVRRKSKK